MTSTIQFPALVIGLMSGTSADGVDAALLYTDGCAVAAQGPALFMEYSDELRHAILELMQGRGDEAAVAFALTEVHCLAIEELLKRAGRTTAEIALIGFHGQTIKHDPKNGITVQIGDAEYMAKRLHIPVVADFRSNDVQQGGQGAPLVPLYHGALAQDLPKPLMVVNIGGVANVTWIGSNLSNDPRVVSHGEPERSERGGAAAGAAAPLARSAANILAFDCGPGNALLDDWVHKHTGLRYDANGALASKGKVDPFAVTKFLQHPYFTQPAPKSLDRQQFHDVLPSIADFSATDGAATLTAMTAASIAKACKLVPEMPRRLLITGGGRHNPVLMRMILDYSAKDVEVAPVEAVGWNGDMLEAQAFAYLAARSVQGLPLSLPETTGVSAPTTGGIFYAA